MGARFGAASSHLKLYPEQEMEGELNALAETGAGWVRCDFAWADLEPVRGSWNFAGADAVVAEAGSRGIQVLGILGTSPPWANGGNDWNYPPTDLEAWRNYVRTVCGRYRGLVPAWEIWNEENIPQFWMPAPDVDRYLELLAAASQEIRAVDPGARVVMGGMAGLGYDYLNQCLEKGAADYVDAVAYHPYAETIGVEGQPEEDLYRPKERLCRTLVDFVRWVISQHTDRQLEIWITEVGWTTCADSPPGVDEATQASYLLRTVINYAGTAVDRVFWYSLRDDLTNPWDRYGLLDYAFRPKPSLHYLRTFEQVFGSASAEEPEAISMTCGEPSSLEAHCFRCPDGSLAVGVWKSDDLADTVDITVNDTSLLAAFRVDNLTGQRTPVTGAGRDGEGRLLLEGLGVGKDPLLLEIKEGEPAPSPQPATSFLFAEGYTGEGFEEWLCLFNPDAQETAQAQITYCFTDGSTQKQVLEVPPRTRRTVFVNSVVGEGKEVSVLLASDRPLAAERPMYFNYGGKWAGGHVVTGLSQPATSFLFAEGYTGEGFE
ncbi:MAG: beta-galactosidase, partial [Actinomycetota bacterium]|nr:beta-galactosidase [Actinomycetota bacterium]